jgi:hypothetical protein
VGHDHEPPLSHSEGLKSYEDICTLSFSFPLSLCFLCSVSIKFGKLITNTTLLVCSARVPWFVELVSAQWDRGRRGYDWVCRHLGVGRQQMDDIGYNRTQSVDQD